MPLFQQTMERICVARRPLTESTLMVYGCDPDLDPDPGPDSHQAQVDGSYRHVPRLKADALNGAVYEVTACITRADYVAALVRLAAHTHAKKRINPPLVFLDIAVR
jgi:hypothetical protein